MKRNLYLLGMILFALQTSCWAVAPWIAMENCTLAGNAYNDGDSFHVRHEGREYIFRLYFVDTPESDDSFLERVRDQAGYFGVSIPTVVQVGNEATAFVQKQLTSQSFTVITRWQGAQGRSKLPRFYAFIKVGGQDLDKMLVSQGLARVYGVRATLPDGTPAETARAALLSLEDTARHSRLGAWTTTRQLNVAEARAEAARSETKVLMAPHTISTYTAEIPRQRFGRISRDTHVHLLEEYPDGWIRVAYEVDGKDQEAVCLRWELGLPELPTAPPAQRANRATPGNP